MTVPTSLRWRLLRSAAFALVATQIAAFGHMVGGGGAPDPAILVIGAGSIGALVTGLTQRQRSFSSILGVMVAAQLAFHLLFTLDVHSMAGHSFLPDDPARMLVFHAVAAALSAVVLATGDAALFGLFRALRRAVTLRAPALAAGRPLWTARSADVPARRPAGALLSVSPRRGPPTVR
ncbi:hypothetical protein [Nakamurella panacisegetis]|uniref:hypothetical protein n=1 Tax=Nakamurella panacisegetis TaxID=1090615 RepID=UPI0012FD4FF3|nr:hypothetical protein [Nakamurella panacisegetis]